MEPRTLFSTGQLDPTFDGDGIALPPEAYFNDDANDAAIQPDGKVIVVGQHVAQPDPSDDTFEFGVARYNADGSVDRSFGNGGRVATDVTAGWDFANDVTLLPDGDIVIAGVGGPGGDTLAVARYNPDGSLDTAFGGDGKVSFNAAGRDTNIFAAAAQPDGKVLLAGLVGGPTQERHDMVIVRLLRDGTPDPAFSGDGVALLDAGGSDAAQALLLRPDGRIVVVGHSSKNDRSNIVAARLNADGTPDPSFGTGGLAVLDPYPGAVGAALQGDKILIALPAESDWLMRLNADGSLDTTFGTGGRVAARPPGGVVGIAVLADGRIVAGGNAPAPLTGGVSAARYTPDGQLDTTFGNGGVAVAAYPRVSAAADVVIDPGGRVLVAATYDNTDFAVGAFRADGTTDTAYGTNGLASARAALPESFGVFYDLAVLPGGKVLAVGTARASDAPDNADVYLARYNADGSLDPTFGGGDGKVLADFGGAEAALRLAVRPDGRFLVYGSVLARYNPDGSLDRTFAGGAGYLALARDPDSLFRQHGLALQADDKILIARAGGVERYTADGALDPTFGSGGRVSDFSALQTLQGFDAVDVAVQPGGNIILAGEASQDEDVVDSDGEDVVVLRLTPAGRVDHSFASGFGYAWGSADYGDRANRLAVGPDGQIALAASEDDDEANVLFVDPDGTHSQLVTLEQWWLGYPRDVAFAPDGKVVVAGFQYNWEYDQQAVRVARFNTDRTIDTTFGGMSDGIRVDVVPGRSDQAYGVAVAPDGDVLVAGGAGFLPMVLRFDGGPSRGIFLAPDGTLTVVGGDAADQIAVEFSGQGVVARLDGSTRTFPTDQVRNVVVRGEGGDDTISAAAVPGDRKLLVYGGDGDDRIAAARAPGPFSWSPAPRIDGGAGNDVLTGGPADDLFLGGDGDDTLDGAGGADTMSGGPGTDTADYSSRTADLFIALDDQRNDGEAGEKDGLGGIEKVRGGSGNDRMSGTDAFGGYAFFGNAGNDTLVGNNAANALWGGAGTDALEGRGGSDLLNGGDGNDALHGDDGDDTLDGGLGNDLLSGGPGTDAADYSARTSRLTVSLNNKPDDGGRGERDNVTDDVEDVIGGSGDDRISGSATNNRIWGGAGRDTLSGGGGRDQLRGQAGNDTLVARGDGAIDFLDGGSGTDRALKDPDDFAQYVEQLLA